MAKSGDRVLIIDENDSLEKGFVTGLSQAGFSVALVPGLTRALQTLHVFKPDMIILNHLSDESLETCRQLHDGFCIPVILLGDDHSHEIWTRALTESKADLYVKKPFCIEELVARFQAILRRYRTSGINPELPEKSAGVVEL